MLQRHSSRRNRLDRSVLNQRRASAAGYDRIAGYCRSSLFEALPHDQALYDALVRKRIEVRVLPDSAFGLIHDRRDQESLDHTSGRSAVGSAAFAL
ncbi:MAG: hypothetical protein MUE46_02055 [Xanthomonadales bacterium]|jgi:hypothetical protein|nr:hypothetical protein [Xanthomonadales bacterium]